MIRSILAVFLSAILAMAQNQLLLTGAGGPGGVPLSSFLLTINTLPTTRHDASGANGWGFLTAGTASTVTIQKFRIWCWAADGSGGTASTGTYNIGIAHLNPAAYNADTGGSVSMTGCTPGTWGPTGTFSPPLTTSNGTNYTIVIVPPSGVTMGDHSGGSYTFDTTHFGGVTSVLWDNSSTNFTTFTAGQQLGGPIDILF